MSDKPVPVNVEDFIRKMFDPNTSHNVRENFRDHVEVIAKVCTEAVFKYDARPKSTRNK